VGEIRARSTGDQKQSLSAPEAKIRFEIKGCRDSYWMLPIGPPYWGMAIVMVRPVSIPTGSWPLEMRAETAAAYCDEPSADAFLSKVDRGIYSPPARMKGCLPKWHRLKLDRDIARRHGLRFDNIALTEDVTELI
jgi:hypothetical protein